MKILTTTILTMALVMLGFVAAQSKSMDGSMAKSGGSSTAESMQQGDMKMPPDGMMKDDGMHMQQDKMKMDADEMMKDDDMHKKDEMKMDQSSIPTDEELRSRLTPLQYKVTRQEGTEPPFTNAYWDNHEAGIYVDIISGKPLFSSADKYDSGTGWPSFTRPLDPDQIVEREDRRLFSVRTEVRSKDADAHLGHVFNDGPAPTGLRYCMNSAALRFVPVADLEKEGYAEYKQLFK